MSTITSEIDTFTGREQLLAVALDVAREAGQIVLKGFRHGVRAEHKGPVDLVTRFDRESEKFLRDALHARTSFNVVGEEGGADQLASGAAADAPTWYVDPIDGTTNFVHGHFFYCVSVGLARGNEPILGAIVAPSLHTEWTGIVGTRGAASSALRNGTSCRVSDVDKFSDALLATGFPYDRRESADNNFDAFVAIKKECQAVRRCGSAALDLCLVADGTYDGYWEKKLRPWDITAGTALVLAAGGRVSSYDDTPIDVRTGEVIATNQKIHRALFQKLAGIGR
ncbi:MAG: inositol monophosphatase family protein [Polyangiaceae bacterium]